MVSKISKYNVEVEYEDGIFLYNTLTNNILPVSFEDYAVIETLLEHLPEFKKEYTDLFNTFKKSGFIISSDFDELAFIRLQNKKQIFANKNYNITINPTLDCNLKCWYCSVDSAGTKHNKERMSNEMIKGLKNHIEYLVIKQKARSISLDWFGGEPMLCFDEIVNEVSEFAKRITTEHNVSFRQQITTNGTLLNKNRIKKMRNGNFTFFQISTDGNESRHNRIKYYANKKGTFKDVIENVNSLAEIIPNVKITLRINYDRQTLKDATDIIPLFSEKSKKCITVDFQRVWQISTNENIMTLLQKTKAEFKEAGFGSSFWAYKPQRFQRCYADSFNHYVINYNGKVFKCTARDYGDDLVIGTLNSSGLIRWNNSILSKMFEKATFENKTCLSCKRLPICMGPCIQRNYDARKRDSDIKCPYNYVEYSLNSFVIDLAKQKKLI